MKRFRHLLISLTGSKADRAAMEWARLVAGAAGSRSIEAVIIDPEPADWLPEYPATEGQAPWKERVSGTADDLEAAFADMEDISLRTTSQVGAPLPTILQKLVDSDCDLVVVGVADDSDRRLAEKLARKSPASVLIVPAGTEPVCRSILTPVDFSDPSALAFEIASAFASHFHADPIRTLHGYRIPERNRYLGASYRDLLELVERTALNQLSTFVSESAQNHPAEPVARQADLASSAIVEELKARHYDLLVMATRGRNSLLQSLLGSNTANVIRHAHLPVLAVKTKGEGRSLLRSMLGKREKSAAEPALHP